MKTSTGGKERKKSEKKSNHFTRARFSFKNSFKGFNYMEKNNTAMFRNNLNKPIWEIGKFGEQQAKVWLKKNGATVYTEGYTSESYWERKDKNILFDLSNLQEVQRGFIEQIENKISRKLTKVEAYYLVDSNPNKKVLLKIQEKIGRELSEKEKLFVGQPYADFFVIFPDNTFGWVEVKSTKGNRKLPTAFSGKRQTIVFNLLKGTEVPLFILRVYLKEEKSEFKLIRWQ